MEKLVKKIELLFFCDDANGDWGVAPKQTFDHKSYEKFNAFWSGIGLFHDVFEHYFELKGEYFKGKYGMNVGGEMAAMGHMWYYQMKLGLYSKRRLNPVSWHSDGEIMRISTESMIQESIQCGYTDFGDTLESNVPRQKPIDDSEFEYQLEKYWTNVKEFHYTDKHKQDKERSIAYKKSVSFRKIADLHRWGFREAERFVPDNMDNRDTLYSFIDFWNDFTKNNKAEDLRYIFSQLNFYIYREGDRIYWKAKLISGDSMIKNYIIRHSKSIEGELFEEELELN